MALLLTRYSDVDGQADLTTVRDSILSDQITIIGGSNFDLWTKSFIKFIQSNSVITNTVITKSRL